MQLFLALFSLIVTGVIVWLLYDLYIRPKESAKSTGEVATPAAAEAVAELPPAAETAAVEAAATEAVVAEEAATAAAVVEEESPEVAEATRAAAVVALAEVEEEAPVEAAAEDEGAEAVEVASAAVVAEEVAEALPAVSGYPDNLTLIKGIGKVYQERLYQAGIFTWDQVSSADIDTLRSISGAIDAANAHDWPRQARALAEKNNRVGAVYEGPMPDDLTQIPGVGAASAQRLYQASILTYAQLAAATPDQLSGITGGETEADQAQIGTWIAAAGELSKA